MVLMEGYIKVGYDNKDLYRFLSDLIDEFTEMEIDTKYGEIYNRGVIAGLKIAKDHIKLD